MIGISGKINKIDTQETNRINETELLKKNKKTDMPLARIIKKQGPK